MDTKRFLQSCLAAVLGLFMSLPCLARLQALDNFVLTGFGQRCCANGYLSPDANSPPKWQVVTDARRSFDLQGHQAFNQERNSFMYPLAANQQQAQAAMAFCERNRETGMPFLGCPVKYATTGALPLE